jgi:hypothetical protein
MRSTILGAGVIAGLAAAVGLSFGATGPSHFTAPPRDSFTGSVTGGSGRYAHASGRLTLSLRHGRGNAVVVTVSGRPCGHTAGCLSLHGRLNGTIVRTPASPPDTGAVSRLDVTGRAQPLGRATLTGTIHGTGFIAHGRETAQLALSGPRGRVSIAARSRVVPGFTSP